MVLGIVFQDALEFNPRTGEGRNPLTRLASATMTPPPSRYSDEQIAKRIEDKRIEVGLSVEQAAEVIGLANWSWYKKVAGTTPFKVIEIGRFATYVKAPTGWPFIDWTAGEAFDAWRGRK